MSAVSLRGQKLMLFCMLRAEYFEHKLTAEGRKTGFWVVDHYKDNSQLELASWPVC